MRQLDLDVPVPAGRSERLAETAGRLGITLPELLASSAAAYARKAAAASPQRGSLRKTVGWGARPPEEPDAERVPVRLGPEVLDLIESARRAVRWEGPDGTTAPVTLEEYLLGATERMVRSAPAGEAPRRAASGAPSGQLGSADPSTVTRPGVGIPHLRWVLIGAGALTAVFLGLALVLVAMRGRAHQEAVPVGKPEPAPPPLLPDPRMTQKDAPSPPPPSGPSGDPARAGEAVSRWERQATALGPKAGAPTHTQEIDSILAEHLGKGARDDAYDPAIDAAVRDVGELYPVPRALVKAIIRRESAFNPRARSRVGAIGLMQLMPFNARKVGLREADLWDPTKNILGGTRLLAALLRYYNGDMVAALAAYNAKPRNPFAPLPRNGETPEYVTVVLRYFDEYTRAPGGGLAPRPGTP